MDLITISIPVYNVEEYVEQALLSALGQTYENIEYLVIDDKGNDNSMAIVKNIVSMHPRGQYMRIVEHPVNLGLGETRNISIDLANGKYLFFLDSDDEITPDCIEKLYEEMQNTNVDMVVGSYNEIVGSKVTSLRKNNRILKKDKEEIILSYFDKYFYVPLWNKLYKTSFLRINNIKCVPHQTIEDNYFTFQVLLHAQAYSVIPNVTYLHYLRDQSVTSGGKGNVKIFNQLPQIFIDIAALIQESSLDTTLRLKVKKKFFKRRWGISELALKSPYNVKHCINEYLSPALLKDKDIFRSPFLFFAYIISIMPLWVKKVGLFIHIKLT
jgi:glycosyltransferase involved in cell wall biosynthesis